MTLVRNKSLPAQHPGKVFKTKILDAHNITISAAAKKMQVNRPHLNNFTQGKVSVSAAFAMKLEVATGISAGFWMNLQKTYDLHINRNLVTEAEPLYAINTISQHTK
ncbi:HigA family addiction module antitoxin [Ningiella sp. W23]|uniref:HigA family addiction module antitoxin n=1 Tax=Ningiella sp. W23 TaxID=3023715 RepID=UPI0037565C87